MTGFVRVHELARLLDSPLPLHRLVRTSMIAGLTLWDKDCLVSRAQKAAPGDSDWPTSGLTEGRGAKGGEGGGGGGGGGSGTSAAAARRWPTARW